MSLAAGTLIDGKYRVVRLLGAGGMGEVYEVENVLVRRGAALKLLPVGASPEIVSRFEAEAQAAGRAGSKRIVDVLDLGRTSAGQAYLVMELLEGETLRDELRRARRMAPRRAAALVVDVLRGLEAAHAAGIVHRDLKPENIWVLAPGGGSAVDAPLVKILDFGVSKFTTMEEGRPKTAEGMMIGTCWYMSPEQIRDARRTDARSDVYALGVILYELLSGNVPFPGQSMPEMIAAVLHDAPPPLGLRAPQAPAALVQIAMRALSKDPGDRFPTAAAMRQQLTSFLDARGGLDVDPGPSTSGADGGPRLDLPRSAASSPEVVTEEMPSPVAPPPATPVLPTPEPLPAAPPTPPAAAPVPVPLSLAEAPSPAAARADAGWPRAALLVGAVALVVILASSIVGTLYRTGVLGS